MDNQSDVVDIVAWSARRAQRERSRLKSDSADDGRVVPLVSTGRRPVPVDPETPPTGPSPDTAA